MDVFEPQRVEAETRLTEILYTIFKRQFMAVAEWLLEVREALEAAQADWSLVVKAAPLEVDVDWLKEQVLTGDVLGEEFLAVLATAMGAVAEQYASVGVGISYEIWDTAAAELAKTYRYDLIQRITDSTRTQIGGAIGDWIESGKGFDSLVMDIRRILPENPFPNVVDRARLIAQTETTRIYADARAAGVTAAGRNGLTWLTVNDPFMCPLCIPMNEVEGTVDGGFINPETGEVVSRPPLHPNCRCYCVDSLLEMQNQIVEWASPESN